MNLLHPASPRAQRAIDIATIAVLAIADVAIIILFSFVVGISDVPNKQAEDMIDRIYLFLTGDLILGVALSFLKPRLGGLILLIPIIIFSYYAVIIFYNSWNSPVGYFY